jgi:hypothetical protein
MATVLVPARDDLLSAWVRDAMSASRPRGMASSKRPGGIRFAFYGRLSTVEFAPTCDTTPEPSAVTRRSFAHAVDCTSEVPPW